MSWLCPCMCATPYKMPPGEYMKCGWNWISSFQTFLLCVVSYENGISCETSSPRLPLNPFLFQNKSARKWSQSLLGCFLPCLFTPTLRLIVRDDVRFPEFTVRTLRLWNLCFSNSLFVLIIPLRLRWKYNSSTFFWPSVTCIKSKCTWRKTRIENTVQMP